MRAFLLASLLSFAPAVLSAATDGSGAKPSRPATEAERALLTEAVTTTARDHRNWAYTETSVQRDDKGKMKRETVVRIDPSKPYAEQQVPLRINGRAPNENDLKKYRERGERRQKQAEQRESAPKRLNEEKRSLGELMQLGAATVVNEDDRSLTFEVPLPTRDNKRFPPEKFLVLVRVNKERKALENVTVKLRKSLRAAVIVKVKSGTAAIDFAALDETHPPVMTSVVGDASVSMMFVPISASLEMKRTEWKRVKPYADRFGVEIGDLKAIDF